MTWKLGPKHLFCELDCQVMVELLNSSRTLCRFKRKRFLRCYRYGWLTVLDRLNLCMWKESKIQLLTGCHGKLFFLSKLSWEAIQERGIRAVEPLRQKKVAA